MPSELNSTPRGMRVNIGVFGNVNAGKSTFVNAVTGRSTAITSPVAGTTTDPVYKAMELLPIGPVVFIDTAGLDDETGKNAHNMQPAPVIVHGIRKAPPFPALTHFAVGIEITQPVFSYFLSHGSHLPVVS